MTVTQQTPTTEQAALLARNEGWILWFGESDETPIPEGLVEVWFCGEVHKLASEDLSWDTGDAPWTIKAYRIPSCKSMSAPFTQATLPDVAFAACIADSPGSCVVIDDSTFECVHVTTLGWLTYQEAFNRLQMLDGSPFGTRRYRL